MTFHNGAKVIRAGQEAERRSSQDAALQDRRSSANRKGSGGEARRLLKPRFRSNDGRTDGGGVCVVDRDPSNGAVAEQKQDGDV